MVHPFLPHHPLFNFPSPTMDRNHVNDEDKNQVAIVTGAAVGIGFEICKQLLANGTCVILNDLDEKLAQKAVAEMNRTYPQKCIGFPGDAADISFIQKMVKFATDQFGSLDIVVANAGITVFGEFLTYTQTDFQKVVNLNLAGTFFLVQAAANQMILQGKGGSMVLMSSVTGHQAHKNLAAYGMSKAALEMLAKTLVLELSPHKININAVAPGATMTERTSQEADYEKIWSSITPMGRPAYPSDIAHAVAFLVSEKARHITGQSLVIDGGWAATSPSPYGK